MAGVAFYSRNSCRINILVDIMTKKKQADAAINIVAFGSVLFMCFLFLEYAITPDYWLLIDAILSIF